MYALIKNSLVSKFPYSIQEFRRDNPQISLPVEPTIQQLAEVGVCEVTLVPEPQVAFDKVTEGNQVTWLNGAWVQTWTIRDATEVELIHKKTAFQSAVIEATQARLDTFASSRNYDGILSACTYATSGIPQFASEGQAAIAARDATWANLYAIFGEVQAGTRPMPTNFADIESDLPALGWPA